MLNSPPSTISSSSIIFANSNSILADAFQSSTSTTSCSSIITTNSSSRTKQYTCERIKFILKQQPSIYIIIKNDKKNSSLCWKVFGFPAKKLENTNQYEKIEGLTSWQSCF